MSELKTCDHGTFDRFSAGLKEEDRKYMQWRTEDEAAVNSLEVGTLNAEF